jgi:hypothetical protein
MRRLKKVTAVLLLAAVMSMGGGLALAGPSETPGRTISAKTTVVAESPGLLDTILIMATLTM